MITNTANFIIYVNEYTSYAVPSAPPQALSGIAQSSTLLTFIWSPPPSIDINGIIQYYVVMVSEQETGRFWSFFAVDADINLASLHPFFNYECQVAAFTTASGPYTNSVIVQTDEAGKFSKIIQMSVYLL